MRVELRLYASLTRYLPERRDGHVCILEIESGTPIRDLFSKLNIPSDIPKVIFLNGVHAKGDEILKEGDRLGVFPPVAGG